MNFYNVHTHNFTQNEFVTELVNQYPENFHERIPFFSIGIHPWYIKEEKVLSDLEILNQKIEQNNCLAIGECGLDKRIDIPLKIQKEVLEKQVIIAEKYQKPVIIHCVGMFQELVDIKKRLKISVPFVIHGFSKNIQTAQLLLKEGFYLSFGKYLIQNPKLKDVFVAIPNNRIFLETDTTLNDIETIYAVAANYKKIELPEMKRMINENWNAVFTNFKNTTNGI